LLEENGIEDAEAMSFDEMNQVIIDKSIKSPDKNPLSENYCSDVETSI
jgi:hypothetical protein